MTQDTTTGIAIPEDVMEAATRFALDSYGGDGLEISIRHLEAQFALAIMAEREQLVLVGWRWKSDLSDRWQYVDGPEKPYLGHTEAFSKRVAWEPVYAIRTHTKGADHE